MDIQSVKQSVRAFIATNFYLPAPELLGDEASLLDEGIVDSTGVIEVISFLERTFELSIDDAEITRDNLDTIQRICGFVLRKLAPAAQPRSVSSGEPVANPQLLPS